MIVFLKRECFLFKTSNNCHPEFSSGSLQNWDRFWL
jgi:hypothetical protein